MVKRATETFNLLQNELKNYVARFTTHVNKFFSKVLSR